MKTLLIEDSVADIRLIREMLREAPTETFEFVRADRLDAATERVRREKFDVVLLDLGLPDSQGIGTLVQFQKANGGLPIIVLTGLNDEAFAVRAIHNGAQDYLVKGRFNSDLLVRSIRYAVERKKAEQTLKAERQRLYDVLETLPPMICLLTSDYEVVFSNRAFRERFGKAEGRPCYEICFGQTTPCAFCESFMALQTGQPHHWEFTSSDGHVMGIYDFPFTDTDGSHMVLEMEIDITERRRAEEVVARFHAELARFNQLAIGRELRMVELKQRINELSRQLDQPEPFTPNLLLEDFAAAGPAAEERAVECQPYALNPGFQAEPRKKRKENTMKNQQTAPTRVAPGTRSLIPTPEEIARRAYEIWRQSGQPQGHAMDHWLLAEKQLQQEQQAGRLAL